MNLRAIGTSRAREYVIENVSMLIASGMGIAEALDAVRGDEHTKSVRKIIDKIKEDVEAGVSLWRALDAMKLFPSHTISLIRIGEESGKLAQNLRVVSLEQEKERAFRSKIRSAMMYPLFVLCLTAVIGIGIAWFILPKLATVFSQLHLKLPFVTRILIDTGLFLGERGTVVVPAGILGIAMIAYFLFSFPLTKRIGQSALFWFPGAKQLIQQIELSRFGYLLGTLLGAGLPLMQALNSVTEATSSPQYRKFFQFLSKSIEEGNSFQKSFNAYRRLSRLIPVPVQRLITTAEQSGNLAETLLKISEGYEAKVETTTKDLTVILEPVLLVIVWLGVVSVALAVILPIYNLIGGFQAY
jgi:type IV pilus assembly protein PilC